MKNKKYFLLVVSFFLIITSAALIFSRGYLQNLVVTNTNQDPHYLIEARKNIIGVWSSDDFPENTWEFKANGELKITRDTNGVIYIDSYKIVNISPICGYDVDVDEQEETMYVVQKNKEDGRELCSELRFFPGNKRIGLWSLGFGANGNSTFSKK
jgi:hypothetical protein